MPRSSIASIAPCVSSGHRSNARFAECHISSTGGADELRQALPAVFRRFLVRPFQPLSQNCWYASLKPAGVLTVPSSSQLARLRDRPDVERIEHVGRELRRLFENRRDRVGRRLLEARQRRDLLEPGELVQHELHFGERGVIGAHARLDLRIDGMRSVRPRARRNALMRGRRRRRAQLGGELGTIWNRSPTRP